MLFPYLIFSVFMQIDQPADIIKKQLIAYNERNIQDFIVLFDEEAAFYRYGESTPFLKGKENIKDYYANLFEQSPDLNSEIQSRIIIGNKVIDHEVITGRMGNLAPVELVLIFEVSENKIIRCEVITKDLR